MKKQNKSSVKKKTKQDSPTTLRIPDDIKIKAMERAGEESRSLSNLIIIALKEYLKKKLINQSQ